MIALTGAPEAQALCRITGVSSEVDGEYGASEATHKIWRGRELRAYDPPTLTGSMSKEAAAERGMKVNFHRDSMVRSIHGFTLQEVLSLT